MDKPIKQQQRGVTLIELLVAMSVSGLVLIAVLGIFGFSTRQFGAQTGRAETVLLDNQAMDAMCKEMGQAVSTATDNQGRLYFIMPGTSDNNGNFILTFIGSGLGYSSGICTEFLTADAAGNSKSTGTVLWRETSSTGNNGNSYTPDTTWSLMPGGKPALPRFPNVSALTYTTTGMPANTVQVSMTMADKVGGQTSSYTVTRIVYLANHN